jgi:hypothetical protein
MTLTNKGGDLKIEDYQLNVVIMTAITGGQARSVAKSLAV